MKNVKLIVEVDGEIYHFWVTKGTQEEVHELTRNLSMFIKKEKIWNLEE